jgi:pyruvate dehydrogenase E1 component alpha subunit
MSDPGITYRDRDEVANTRSSRDPIENLKKMIFDAGFATPEEVKEIEKAVRKEVAAEIKVAKKSSIPAPMAMYSDISLDLDGKPTYPEFIRGVETTSCLVNGKVGNSL